MNVKIAADLSVRRINGEIFVLKRSTSCIHSFNKTGACIWEMLQNNSTTPEIQAELIKRFEASKKNIEDDVAEFIDALIKNQLITLSSMAS